MSAACPGCQATNPETARWCGQCYRPLGEPEPVAGPARVAEPEPEPHAAREAEQAPVQPRAGTQPAGGVRARDGEVEWSCAVCGLFNPLAAATCVACGTPLTARFETPSARRQAAEPDWRAALALTALLPGAGHVFAARPATGTARALLFVVWLGGGLLLLGGGGAALAAVPLLLGALFVWAGSVLDIVSLSRRGPELLGSRTLLWLVVGVTMLSVTGLVAGFVSLA